ncbi:MAG: response regulator [Thermoproteota archaeon]|nr:response regulator [Thermoproteota archaeon]
MRTALRDNGFEEVDAYNDPILALQNFKSRVYALLITDVAMPKIDGFKLYQEMKKRDNNIKAIFVTAFKVNYEVLRDLFSGGGVDIYDEDVAAILADSGGRFIRKPVHLHELVKRVKTELQNKRICKYCGWDIDEPDSEILSFFHSDCWKEYRKDGLLDPMPENVW